MPKTARAKTKANKELSVEKVMLDLLPLSCRHHADHSEIEGYIGGADDWNTIVAIHDGNGLRAKALAEFLVLTANSFEKHRDLIAQMATALELCLGCDGKLTWEAEQEARVVLGRAKRATGMPERG